MSSVCEDMCVNFCILSIHHIISDARGENALRIESIEDAMPSSKVREKVTLSSLDVEPLSLSSLLCIIVVLLMVTF